MEAGGDNPYVLVTVLGSFATFIGACFRYLLREIDKRDKIIEKNTESQLAQNKLIEQMASLYVESQRKRPDG